MLILSAFWLWQEQIVNRSGGLLDLILRSSPIAKIVLLILFGFSIVSWAIIILKAIETKKVQQQSEEFLQAFRQSIRLSDLKADSSTLSESPLVALYLAADEEIRAQRSQATDLVNLNLEAVSRVLQSASIAEATRLERKLGWLASTASAAPFIGLFGTVVGIIIAFQGLSQAASTSIQAVAPGIAEALVATAAGIGAAVPAVLAYNHYLNHVRVMAAQMDSFSLRLLNFIEREYNLNRGSSVESQAHPIPLGHCS